MKSFVIFSAVACLVLVFAAGGFEEPDCDDRCPPLKKDYTSTGKCKRGDQYGKQNCSCYVYCHSHNSKSGAYDQDLGPMIVGASCCLSETENGICHINSKGDPYCKRIPDDPPEEEETDGYEKPVCEDQCPPLKKDYTAGKCYRGDQYGKKKCNCFVNCPSHNASSTGEFASDFGFMYVGANCCLSETENGTCHVNSKGRPYCKKIPDNPPEEKKTDAGWIIPNDCNDLCSPIPKGYEDVTCHRADLNAPKCSCVVECYYYNNKTDNWIQKDVPMTFGVPCCYGNSKATCDIDRNGLGYCKTNDPEIKTTKSPPTEPPMEWTEQGWYHG